MRNFCLNFHFTRMMQTFCEKEPCAGVNCEKIWEIHKNKETYVCFSCYFSKFVIWSVWLESVIQWITVFRACFISYNFLFAINISLSTQNGVEEIGREKQNLSQICHITDLCYRNFTLCSPMTFVQKVVKYVSSLWMVIFVLFPWGCQ